MAVLGTTPTKNVTVMTQKSAKSLAVMPCTLCNQSTKSTAPHHRQEQALHQLNEPIGIPNKVIKKIIFN